MRVWLMVVLSVVGLEAQAGKRIGEIKWMSSKEAFRKANDKKTRRWVLVYKEWPR